jgi:hypothetical protein
VDVLLPARGRIVVSEASVSQSVRTEGCDVATYGSRRRFRRPALTGESPPCLGGSGDVGNLVSGVGLCGGTGSGFAGEVSLGGGASSDRGGIK